MGSFVGLNEDEDGIEELTIGDSLLLVISVAMEERKESYKGGRILLCKAIKSSDTI